MEWARAGTGFLAVHCRTEDDAQQIKREVDQFSVIGMPWYRSFRIKSCSPRKDKPIVAAGRPSHPQLAKLPEWSVRTIAVPYTANGGPHTIPVAAPFRAADQRTLVQRRQ